LVPAAVGQKVEINPATDGRLRIAAVELVSAGAIV
jgi:hypothetical protein